MNRTNIEWCRNPDGSPGWTWNVITGCLNNCSYCFARKLANGRLKSRYLANHDIARVPQIIPKPSNPFYPRFWEDRLGDPIWLPSSHRKPIPKGIFPCDMSDLFGIGIPKEWTEAVMNVIKASPYNRYYLLTKQPQNLPQWSPFPDNVWLGVSATNQQQFDKAVEYLKEVKATVKFISFEPLLERINLDL